VAQRQMMIMMRCRCPTKEIAEVPGPHQSLQPNP